MFAKKKKEVTENSIQDKSLIAKIQPQGGIAFNGEKLITTCENTAARRDCLQWRKADNDR